MPVNEMVEVLAIDSREDSCFRPEQWLPDPRDILTICSTLISIRGAATNDTSSETLGMQELRLAHSFVKEYLIPDRLKNTSMRRYHVTSLPANESITRTCLTYLLHFKSFTILAARFRH